VEQKIFPKKFRTVILISQLNLKKNNIKNQPVITVDSIRH